MARLSRLQLPVFSVSEWSVDQHSPADPEAATREGKQNGWGKRVDRKGLEGRERRWCGSGACPRAQPANKAAIIHVGLLLDMISLADYPQPGQSLSLFFTCIFVMSLLF